MRRADLHIHTTASGDSPLQPEDIFEQAVAAGLAAIAFTDHDGTAHNDLGRQLAARHGIEFLAGVELTCSWQSQLAHLLGYFPAGVGPTLRPFILNTIATHTRQHALTVLEHLRPLGLDISVEEYDSRTAAMDYHGSPLRQMVLESGFVNSVSEYKARIAALQIESAAKGYPPVPDCVAAIHSAGGFAVLAHPFGAPGFFVFGEADIEALAGLELDGIEVFHPGLEDPQRIKYYATIASRLGLIATGGSDSHGKVPPHSRAYVGGTTCDWDAVRERVHVS